MAEHFTAVVGARTAFLDGGGDTVVRADDGHRNFNGVFHLDDELNGTILYQVKMLGLLSLVEQPLALLKLLLLCDGGNPLNLRLRKSLEEIT